MFGFNVLNGVLTLICGDCWTQEDTSAALSISKDNYAHVLIIDISKLAIPNGFTVATQDVVLDYETVIVVCGSVENRYKVELLVRLAVCHIPIVAVISEEEAAQVMTGLHSHGRHVNLAQ